VFMGGQAMICRDRVVLQMARDEVSNVVHGLSNVMVGWSNFVDGMSNILDGMSNVVESSSSFRALNMYT
jgi:hypothetical protein